MGSITTNGKSITKQFIMKSHIKGNEITKDILDYLVAKRIPLTIVTDHEQGIHTINAGHIIIDSFGYYRIIDYTGISGNHIYLEFTIPTGSTTGKYSRIVSQSVNYGIDYISYDHTLTKLTMNGKDLTLHP